MEKTLYDFSLLMGVVQLVPIIILILILVLGIKCILKLFKLMDSHTQLNKAKLQKLQDDL
ncbi:hypothetical protein [Kordia sp.]|uniref:hypothetical protein n=1 Tax=Kordia sp. TaxID=1965332 RepID=UPI003D268648